MWQKNSTWQKKSQRHNFCERIQIKEQLPIFSCIVVVKETGHDGSSSHPPQLGTLACTFETRPCATWQFLAKRLVKLWAYATKSYRNLHCIHFIHSSFASECIAVSCNPQYISNNLIDNGSWPNHYSCPVNWYTNHLSFRSNTCFKYLCELYQKLNWPSSKPTKFTLCGITCLSNRRSNTSF